MNARKQVQDNRKSSGIGIPNPERKSIPQGLYKADGLGNYVHGDNVR